MHFCEHPQSHCLLPLGDFNSVLGISRDSCFSRVSLGLGCSSVERCLPSMHEAPGSILSTEKRRCKEERKGGRITQRITSLKLTIGQIHDKLISKLVF